ncbi:Dak phosphatase [Xylanimonas oleitrophica]|uniref:Dak phosphatase n=1 Tax=Xylanimonas oleitrophica TaxID=2607479 RepID=A0A2W5Y3G1_9MICO|nr:DAK2 domain-containing protein [Xylanimonas oleitrophica]PZR52324.1 Dak phosphatase [Xylanimonas oleitrophica]
MHDAAAQVTDVLDARGVRTWALLAVGALGRERAAIDSVNVFPVADGDTGTNMHLTVREGARAVGAAPADAGAAALLRRLARGALLGARGNSGVILSEWLRGVAVAATRGDELARALDVAAGSARSAVAHPEPGTILTAADVAAAAARDTAARPGATADDVLEAAVRGAREAALSSVATLAQLARAGVLDAGACGLVLVLDALRVARSVSGTATGPAGPTVLDVASVVPEAPVTLGLDLTGHDADPAAAGTAGHHEHSDDDELELMFVLRRPAAAVGFSAGGVADALRADLDAVGGSVVVVGGAVDDAPADGEEDTAWQAHVHTADLGAGLAVARAWAEQGTVEAVHVRHLAVPDGDQAVVAATTAPVLAAELARAGAVVLVPAAGAVVGPRDLAQAALASGARRALVLAGAGADAAGVDAELGVLALDTDEGPATQVQVLDVPSDVHTAVALAALAEATDERDERGERGDLAAAVRRALRGLRTASTDAGRAPAALARLLDGGPGAAVVTVLTDDDVPPEVVEALEPVAVAAGAELVPLPTGRPGTGVALGVEAAGRTAAEGARTGAGADAGADAGGDA